MRSTAFEGIRAAVVSVAVAVAAVPDPSGAATAVAPPTTDHILQLAADPGHGKILFLMHCKSCHGANAGGDGPRAIPVLAGQREKYIVEQLALFATGMRAGQSMHETMQRPDLGWIKPVRDLAAYLSSAPRNPRPEYGDARDTAAGKRLYEAACTACHGSQGQGTDSGVPAIGGQQYRYLAAQLGNFVSGHRDAENREVLVSMGALSERDIEEVANYASRLGYLASQGGPP